MAQAQANDRFANYVPVSERVEQFYQKFPEGRILTEIVQLDHETGFVLMKSNVYRKADDAEPAATGHAFEVRSESYVNKTSFIENCETSCVGRALALLGFEIKRGLASREEMRKTQPPAEARPGPRPVSRPEDVPGVSKGMPRKATEEDEDKLDQKISDALHILGKPTQDLTKWAQGKFGTSTPWYDHTLEQKEIMFLFLNSKVNKATEGR